MLPVITSKLTSKARTIISQPVRAALSLRAGDDLACVIEGDRVVLMRSNQPLRDDPFATFPEWDSPADVAAYAGL